MSKLTTLALVLATLTAAAAARASEMPDLPRSLQIAKEVRGRPAAPEPAALAQPPVASSTGREPGGR